MYDDFGFLNRDMSEPWIKKIKLFENQVNKNKCKSKPRHDNFL